VHILKNKSKLAWDNNMGKEKTSTQFEHNGETFSAEDLTAAFKARNKRSEYIMAIRSCGAMPCPDIPKKRSCIEAIQHFFLG